ncbi:hypothetical protein HK102_003266 [Quaeritorhiza haematococci]|nr:hypothetical protein HK102_003266 [Quaeritorhiza haematococci]
MLGGQHYFYNIVHPSEVHLYTRPPDQDEALWNQAMMDNPDPSCMVPVLAVGFDDIKKRMEEQDKQNAVHKFKLEEARIQLEKIQRKHHLDTTVKLDEYKRRHAELSHRVLQLIKKVEVLRNKGYSIRADEETLKVRLEAMALQLKKPSQFRGRINELWAQLQQLKESRRLANAAMAGVEYEVADEESLRMIYQAMADMQAGLSHLTDIVKTDQKDTEILWRGYHEQRPQSM